LFTLYFAGHFGYLLQLYHDGSILKGSQSFSLQSLTSLLNTQFALSLLGILALLILIERKKFDTRTAIIMGIIAFMNFGLKFYGGAVSLMLIGVYLCEQLIAKRHIFSTLKHAAIICVLVGMSIILFYSPGEATKSGAPFTFAPFSTVHSMIEEPNMVYLPNMVNARYFLYENAPYSPRLLAIELFSTLIYVVLNFGTRILGILYILYLLIRRKYLRLDVYLLIGLLASTSLTIALIQKGDWWNTVQFSYYGIFFGSILLARILYDLIKTKSFFAYGVTAIIVILTLPGNVQTLQGFSSPKTALIPSNEFAALDHLRKLPQGIVFASFDLEPDAHYPFMSYENTGYVAAFTGKQLYFGHIGPLTILGIDYKKRHERIKKADCSVFDEVRYIYYVKIHKNDLLVQCTAKVTSRFQVIFEDTSVRIYRMR